MGFEKISGAPRVRDYLTAAFQRKTVPHAFLISGSDEAEKRQLAQILAGAIVCTGASAPCDACPACKKAASGNHPDIILKECESASIKVDEIRAIRRDVYLLPNDGEKKVYIINDADKMTQEAQDALLKILEEPPRFTTFILLCYNHNNLLSTVLSRVVHLKLHYRADRLEGDGVEAALQLVSAMAERDELSVLKAFFACEKKKRDEMREVLDTAVLILRDGLIKAASGTDILIDEELGARIAERLSINEILKITDALKEARDLILRNVGVAHVAASCAVKVSGAFI